MTHVFHFPTGIALDYPYELIQSQNEKEKRVGIIFIELSRVEYILQR